MSEHEHTRLNRDRLVRGVKLNLSVIGASYLVTLLLSTGLNGLPEMLLFAKLNIFALPLAYGTSLFDYPTWVWYIASLLWALQYLHYAGFTLRDLVATARGEPA